MVNIKSAFKSSTLNTWFAFSIKSGNVLLFLPLVFKYLDSQEAELWLLFSLFLTFQNVADFGFYNTFVRVISNAYAGVVDLTVGKPKVAASGQPNLVLMGQIIGTMNVIYRFMTLLVLVLGLIGTIVVYDRIIEFKESAPYFWAWGVFILGMCFNFYGRIFSNFLYGINLVYLVRRWEGYFGTISLFVNCFVLIYFQSFLLVALSYQFWILLNVFRNFFLCKYTNNGLYNRIVNYTYDRSIFKFVWPMAWKSGISSLASTGALSISGLWYSTLETAPNLAEYLYTTKMLDSVRNFCKAPFYSKIPLFNQLWSMDDFDKWFNVSYKAIRLGNIIFIVSVILLYLFGVLIFDFLDTQIPFPESKLWLGLSIGYLIHINGAYHTHLYMTSNRVNSHFNDLISGLIFAVGVVIFVPSMGTMGFVISQILAYGCFYFWFAIYFSHRVLERSFISFILKSFLPFIIVLVIIYFINSL